MMLEKEATLQGEALVLECCWHRVPEEAAWLSREQLRCCHASMGVANEPRSFFHFKKRLHVCCLTCKETLAPPIFMYRCHQHPALGALPSV